jgi:hypothetical protein
MTSANFWEVYCGLWDEVEEIPEDFVMSLSQDIFSESNTEGPFALEHLRASENDMKNCVDVDVGVGNESNRGDIFACEFTADGDRDELY